MKNDTPAPEREKEKNEMDVNRVTEMEGILNDCTAAADRMEAGIEGMEQIGERMKKLFSYYGSED